MTIDQFWKTVEGLLTEGAEHALEGRLEQLSPEDLVAFDRHFTEQFFLAYDWLLWNAAYIIKGGCSSLLSPFPKNCPRGTITITTNSAAEAASSLKTRYGSFSA